MTNCDNRVSVVLGAACPMLHPDEDAAMPGGRRKSRKPQKWEDFLADEEQLASLEKELEQEEEARMQSVDGMDGMDDSDGEVALEIVVEDEVNAIKVEKQEKVDVNEAAQGENGEREAVKGEAVKGEKEEPSTPSIIGDCTTCGIQLRDWPSTHSHLRFHRLSHVPACINKANTQSKRINCQVCQRSCQTQEVLAYHAYTEHYVKLRQAKTCPFCCSSFSCLDEFLDHLDITNISFYCEMCGISVTQEHKFYQHIVYCSKKTFSGLTSVPCCVCGAVTKINRLYDHLTHHSTQLNLPYYLSNTKMSNKRVLDPCPPKQQTRFRPFLCEMCDKRFVVYSEYKRHIHSHTKSRAYMCTHCGRSYCQKNTLIVHLYSYHNASANAEEVMPKEDTPQRRCEACGRIGFVSEELLVRHCVMRCPRRNNLQASFAVIIASIAKNQNTSFVETLHSPAMVTYLKLGLEAWQTPAFVRDYLASLQSAASSNPSTNSTVTTDLTTTVTTTTTLTTTTTNNTNTNTTRKDSVEFTDIQLLAYLSQFEEKNREDKEQMAMNSKVKGDGQWGEGKAAQLEDMDEDGEEGGEEESLLPFLCTTTSTPSSPHTTSCSPPLPYPTTTPLINHAALMQHLRRGTDHTQGGGQGEGGSPVDICLVTSTTNTQVTITPAGHHLTQDMKPPKIAKVLPHKPSVAEIRAQYPGVTVLADVDFSRVPYLLMEMRECMSDRHEKAMEAAGFTLQDQQRLEVEAQLLREAEPFYLEEYPIKEKKDDANCSTSPPSPTTLRRLTVEIDELYEGSRKETDLLLSPSSPDSLHKKTKEENCSDMDASQGNTDSSPHSPHRKRSRIETETDTASPLPDKCGGGGSSALSSAPNESFPSKQLIDRLLKEAQALAEG